MIVLLFLLSNTAQSQAPFQSDTSRNLSAQIDNLYNFKPGKLSREEQSKKMPALDGFWQEVKSDTVKYLPQLRVELHQPGHNPFFYYDGSGLLLSLPIY